MTAWMKQAACRGADGELFFPIGEKGPALQQAAEAKAVCRRCPVRTECLDYALDTRSVGIFGGTTEYERQKISRRRQRARV